MYAIVAVALASQAVAATAETTLCQHLSSANVVDEVHLVRAGSRGLSFLIPMGLARKTLKSPDSEEIAWRGDQLEIGYGSGTLRSIRAEEINCELAAGADVRRFSLIESSGSLVAVFPDAYDMSRYHAIQVRSTNTHLQFQILRTLLESTKFVNRVDDLLIEGIAADFKSFRYRNEVADSQTGKIGDIITRDYGRVESISKCSVKIAELVPDGVGGYLEEHKTLQFAGCDFETAKDEP